MIRQDKKIVRLTHTHVPVLYFSTHGRQTKTDLLSVNEENDNFLYPMNDKLELNVKMFSIFNAFYKNHHQQQINETNK